MKPQQCCKTPSGKPNGAAKPRSGHVTRPTSWLPCGSGDVEGVREAIPSTIERAREASLPEYEAMAVANRAWVA